MPMLEDPSSKYAAFVGPDLPDRTWPTKRITKAPRWLSTDLRDGNQALANPLNVDQKWTFFKLLVDIGFKEIEVGHPGASDTDFNFARKCAADAPSDVWLQVMTPCRKDLIRRAVDSLHGAPKAIISLYIATSDDFIDTVFNTSREAQLRTAVEHAAYLRSITKDDPNQNKTTWSLMWSPETFSDTDPAFAVEICQAVKAVWEPSLAVPIVLNLPATVEMSTPNVFADQVELFSRGFIGDDTVCVSVHVHNDRGCAVAASELAQLAGASRVEGCLFGNGERTGNVDLVTLALNLYSQGISPGLNFSDLSSIRKTVEALTQIPTHVRWPYAGDLVFVSYSGGHQDAISKGLKKKSNTNSKRWKIPYLSLDPDDVGRSYEPIIKINSQSGKGGVAWILEHALNLEIPRELAQMFSQVLKTEHEAAGRNLEVEEIIELFLREHGGAGRAVLSHSKSHIITSTGHSTVLVKARLQLRDGQYEFEGQGDTVLDAVRVGLSSLVDARLEFESAEHKFDDARSKKALAVKCTTDDQRSVWNVKAVGGEDEYEEVLAMAALSAALDCNKQLLPISVMA